MTTGQVHRYLQTQGIIRERTAVYRWLKANGSRKPTEYNRWTEWDEADLAAALKYFRKRKVYGVDTAASAPTR